MDVRLAIGSGNSNVDIRNNFILINVQCCMLKLQQIWLNTDQVLPTLTERNNQSIKYKANTLYICNALQISKKATKIKLPYSLAQSSYFITL